MPIRSESQGYHIRESVSVRVRVRVRVRIRVSVRPVHERICFRASCRKTFLFFLPNPCDFLKIRNRVRIRVIVRERVRATVTGLNPRVFLSFRSFFFDVHLHFVPIKPFHSEFSTQN